eukprot:TRINITY_DN1615_c0_g1_i4.p1 TRINITY_DN1615_c0_g1~~TRINITY_DN1615_c0_g1_i4.p1  ORF type:complete len:569 (+),score=127.89 TRINITY_DN1615_c0_g1_i4:916-2622(+)
MCAAISHIFRKVETISGQVNNFEEQLKNKIDTQLCKDKLKNAKTKLLNKIEEKFTVLDQDVKEIDKKFSTKIEDFDQAVKDVERRTIWKISDCQDLLNKRINEEFVFEEIRKLEERLGKENKGGNGMAQGSLDKYDKMMERLQVKIADIELDLQEKVKTLKSNYKDLDQNLKKNYLGNEKFVDAQKDQQNIINGINIRVKNVERMIDNYSPQIESIKVNNQKIEKDMEDLSKQIERSTNQQLNSDDVKNYEFLIQKLDPHKLCQLDGDLKEINQEQKRQRNLINELEQEIKKKLDSVNFMQDISQSAQSKQNKLANLEDVKKMIEEQLPKQTMDDDKFRKIQRDIQDIHYKLELANEIEKRVTRIFKDVDINNLIKMVKQKANEDEVKKELLILDTKCGQLQEQFTFLRRDHDTLQIFVRKQSMQGIASNSLNQSFNQDMCGASLNTKKLYPVKCLSCGQKGQPIQVLLNNYNDQSLYMSQSQLHDRFIKEISPQGNDNIQIMNDDSKVTAKIENTLSSHVPTPKKVGIYQNRRNQQLQDTKKRVRPFSAKRQGEYNSINASMNFTMQ